MAKASVTLENGALVAIEGTVEEVQKLLAFYGSAKNGSTAAMPMPAHVPQASSKQTLAGKTKPAIDESVDLVAIVNHIKSCEEADQIEKQVFDRTGQIPRVLLPLYIVREYMDGAFALTSGDINKVTTELGIPIDVGNASRTLAGSASKYVVGDKVRKKGQPVRYKLSHRGGTYFKELISPKPSR